MLKGPAPAAGFAADLILKSTELLLDSAPILLLVIDSTGKAIVSIRNICAQICSRRGKIQRKRCYISRQFINPNRNIVHSVE